MKRTVIRPPAIPFLLLTVLILAACREGVSVPVTRTIAETMPTPLPVATEQPQPMPTAVAGQTYTGRLWTGDGTPIHGAPPYRANLTADFHDWSRGLPSPCHELQWRFGDGQSHTMPCAIDPAAEPHDWQISHQYDEPGIYHAGVRMILADGAAIESEKSQTILVAEAQAPALGETIIRWLGWLLLFTAIGLALIWLAFQRGRRRLWGAALLFLFLITFVPPFSYVPDPLGIVLAVTGGYRDDLRLPFANRFLVAGDPTSMLRPTLDALVGQTGLDPLDPRQPLAAYQFIAVTRNRTRTDVHVRFTYEGGEQRTYAVPLRHPRDGSGFLGFYPCCWGYDGLGRLRTEHRALPPVSLAAAQTSTLPEAQRLAVSLPETAYAADWFSVAANPLAPRLLWSPRGDAFLTPVAGNAASALWLVELPDGGARANARQIAHNVWSYAWAPGGDAVIYSTVENDAAVSTAGPTMQIRLATRHGGEPRHLLSLPRSQGGFPGITADGLWFVRDGALMLLPWEQATAADGAAGNGASARRLAQLPGLGSAMRRTPVQVSPSPDGQRIAYDCAAGLCLIDAGGGNHTIAAADPRFPALAWRADGEQLAAVFWDYPRDSAVPATLRLFTRDGQQLAEMAFASDGMVDPPTWLPDGETLLLQTYPQDGRRIIRAHPATNQAVDLSRPRWDAFFALHPAGEQLLLSNGRGGFWLAPLGAFQ